MTFALLRLRCAFAGAALALTALTTPAALAQAAAANSQGQTCAQRPCAQPFQEGGLYGIKDAQGNVVIAPRYTKAYRAKDSFPDQPVDGLIIVERDGKVGFVNSRGVETIAPSLSLGGAAPKNGFIFVKRDGRACLVDADGVLAVKCEYDNIFTTSNPNQFMVMAGGRSSYITRSGQAVD